MTPSVIWPQALAWRMRRHHLDPADAASAPDVVRDLCGIQAQVASSAEQAIAVRRATHAPDEVASALAAGSLLKTWALRGTLHLLTPDVGPALLSLMASGRSWERPSWVRYFGVTPDEMERLRLLVRDALAGRTLTREELISAVTAHAGTDHLAKALRSGWGTLLKPIAWQGDLCHGPMRRRNVTFQHPSDATPDWPGLPAAEEAAPIAIAAYLRAYGPAPLGTFSRWLSGGWFGHRKLLAWQVAMGERLAEVEVEGERTFVLAEDLESLLATRPTETLRLLPGFDQWVLGPGTDAPSVVPPGRRTAVSRAAGCTAPTIVAGGRVVGTWATEAGTLTLSRFPETGWMAEPAMLEGELGRWSTILGRSLDLAVGDAAPVD